MTNIALWIERTLFSTALSFTSLGVRTNRVLLYLPWKSEWHPWGGGGGTAEHRARSPLCNSPLPTHQFVLVFGFRLAIGGKAGMSRKRYLVVITMERVNLATTFIFLSDV